MKTLKRFGLIAFSAMALVLTACSGSDDAGNGGGGSSLSTYISAKVAGVQFTTASLQGQSVGVASRSGSGAMETIIVTCSDMTSVGATNYHTMSVILVGVSAPGTYAVNSQTNNTLGYAEETSGTDVSWDTGDCAGVTGTITVTTLSATKIEGTFSFTGAKEDECTNQKIVTEGKFRGTF